MKTKASLAVLFTPIGLIAAFLPCLKPGVMAPVYPTGPGAIAKAYASWETQGNGAISLSVYGTSFTPCKWQAFSMYKVGGTYFPINSVVKTNATSISLTETVFPCAQGANETFVIVMCTDSNGALLAVNEAFIKRP